MWLELRSVKSNNVYFLNPRSSTFQSSSYPIVFTRLGELRSTPNPHLKFVEVPVIEPAPHDNNDNNNNYYYIIIIIIIIIII